MRIKDRISLTLALTIMVFIFPFGRCNNCLDNPTSDSTPPSAGILIEYFQNDQSLTRTLTQDDSPVTIVAAKNRPVTIIYSGQDPEGMKSVHISIVVVIGTGGIQQRQDYTIAPIVSGCPKEILLGTFTLEKDQGSRSASIMVKSKNWMGMQTSTQNHVIKIE